MDDPSSSHPRSRAHSAAADAAHSRGSTASAVLATTIALVVWCADLPARAEPPAASNAAVPSAALPVSSSPAPAAVPNASPPAPVLSMPPSAVNTTQIGPVDETDSSTLTDSEPSARGQQTARRTGPTLTYVGFGVAIAGAVVGTIAGVVAISRTSKLKDDCGDTVCPSSKQDDIKSARSMAGLSTVSFAVALFGATVGFTGLMLSWESESAAPPRDARVRVRPVVGLGALGIDGSF